MSLMHGVYSFITGLLLLLPFGLEVLHHDESVGFVFHLLRPEVGQVLGETGGDQVFHSDLVGSGDSDESGGPDIQRFGMLAQYTDLEFLGEIGHFVLESLCERYFHIYDMYQRRVHWASMCTPALLSMLCTGHRLDTDATMLSNYSLLISDCTWAFMVMRSSWFLGALSSKKPARLYSLVTSENTSLSISMPRS